MGKLHNAANISSRSFYMAGVSVAGFLWLFSQCIRSHHPFPKGGTPTDLYCQQFSFHRLCHWHFVDRLERAPADSTHGETELPLARTLWHEPQCLASDIWQDAHPHDRGSLSDGIDWFTHFGHRPCRAFGSTWRDEGRRSFGSKCDRIVVCHVCSFAGGMVRPIRWQLAMGSRSRSLYPNSDVRRAGSEFIANNTVHGARVTPGQSVSSDIVLALLDRDRPRCFCGVLHDLLGR